MLFEGSFLCIQGLNLLQQTGCLELALLELTVALALLALYLLKVQFGVSEILHGS